MLLHGDAVTTENFSANFHMSIATLNFVILDRSHRIPKIDVVSCGLWAAFILHGVFFLN